MLSPPLVSVIIVNYNYGRFLRQCIQSVLEQSYVNIECIVVDNHSSDNSREIIAGVDWSAAPGRTFKFLGLSQNLFSVKASVAGLKESQGSYVLFLDADDYLLETCVEAHIATQLSLRFPVGMTSVDTVISHGDELVTGTTYGPSIFIAGDQPRHAKIKPIDFDSICGPLSRTGETIELKETELYYVERKFAGRWLWATTSGLCYRRDIIEVLYQYVPEMTDQNDGYIGRGCVALTGCVLIDRSLAVYRQHKSNVFIRRAYLLNFRTYDIGKQDPLLVAKELIRGFVTNAARLNKLLDYPDLFIEAIEAISQTYPGIKPKPGSTSAMLDFIDDNRSELGAAFGPAIVEEWAGRYQSFEQPRKPSALAALWSNLTSLKNR